MDRIFPGSNGLFHGISRVLVSNMILMIYLYLGNELFVTPSTTIQKKKIKYTSYQVRVIKHFKNPEGFLILIIYFCIVWNFKLIPNSYFLYPEDINWSKVSLLLISQDFFQYLVHRLEHKLYLIHHNLYLWSHKKHHRVTNPKFEDAFDGSLLDTIIMILSPLHLSLHLVKGNCKTLSMFGSIYSCWLTLIHSEYSHPWDCLFQKIGWGTPADHHIHHRLLNYNFGHLFMYWDKLFGTYKDPKTLFNI